MAWLKRFEKLVKELRKTSGIKKVEFAKRPGMRPAERDKIAEQADIDPTLLDLWTEADGLSLMWKAGATSGRMELLPLHEVFGDWNGTVYFDDTPANSQLRQLSPFDFFGFGNSACAALRLDGSRRPTVYLYTVGEPRADSMQVDLREYLELALATRGYPNWQAAIVADRSKGRTKPIGADDLNAATALFRDLDLRKLLRHSGAAKRTMKQDDLAKVRAMLDSATVKYSVPATLPKGAIGKHVVLVKSGRANLKAFEDALAPTMPALRGASRELPEVEGLVVNKIEFRVG